VDRDGFATYLDALCQGFGIPPELVGPAFPPEVLDINGFTGFLGRDRATGEPAAASAVFVTGTTAGVYNVATVAAHRRKGYGEAVTAAAARHGAEHHGATHAILQASEAGEPVYRRMGYATPARYRQFEG
jgi:ribosomal protein S18 acetylase RimI-like enzyme